MKRLEVSGAVRPIYGSLGVKRLRVVVKRGTYPAVYSNYRMNEHNLQRVPNTDKKRVKLQRRVKMYT